MDLAAMHDPLLLGTALAALVLLNAVRFLVRRWSLVQLTGRPLPDQWLAWVRAALPFYTRLPRQTQVQLQKQIAYFLWHKRFVGCGGLKVTDQMKVTVAAHACILSLQTLKRPYRQVRWVYLYPIELTLRHQVAHAVLPGPRALHRSDWALLAWHEASQSVYDFNGGRNAALHELSARAQMPVRAGEPLLHGRGAYGTWSLLLTRAKPVDAHPYFGQAALLKDYGATSPAELLAVATESFFGEPEAMAREHKDLFEETRKWLQLHPAAWRAPKPKVAE